MINKLYLKSFMLFDEILFDNFTPVNLFIGENDTGKTSILKALYSIASGIELISNKSQIYSLGIDYSQKAEITSKLNNVFHEKKIRKEGKDISEMELTFNDDDKIKIEIKSSGNMTANMKVPLDYYFNPVFIPPKEILSIKDAIKYSTQIGKIRNFDDTYLDLITYIETPKNIDDNERLDVFKNKNKYDWYNGFVKLIEKNGGKRPVFIKNNVTYEIENVAEGIKKLGIFPILEQAGYLTKKTILFIDEPENSVHPKALRELMRFLVDISKEGVQIFIASHSQFVVQELRNIAKKDKYSINCYSLLKDKENIICNQFNLKDEMAENPILDEAIKMFDESVENG